MFARFTTVLTLGFALATSALQAQSAPDAVFDAIGMPEMIAIMSEEGIDYGEQIATDMFAGNVDPAWSGMVAAIYDPVKITARVKADLAMALQGADTDAIVGFFQTEPGRTIVTLEVSARRAFLDDAVEQTAKENAALAMMDDTPRHRQITAFIDANDLIETNVTAALNSNYAFYMGMLDGGAFPGEMSEQDVLTNVWASESDVRASTTEWVFAFLTLAYQPLSDTDLDAYIAFSQTPAGKDLNRAMFAAFDGVFNDNSRALGLAASRMMGQQEL